MKKIIFILPFLFVSLHSHSQDLLLKNDGDSMNVQITKIRGDYFYYSYFYNDQIRNALIHKSAVKYYQYNYFLPAQNKYIKRRVDFSRLRLGADFGVARQIAPLPDNINSYEREYLDGLRAGNVIGLEGTIYFNRLIGVGILYNHFYSSNSASASRYAPGTTTAIFTGQLTEKISINFISPTFNFRLLSASGMNALVMDAGIGFTEYSDKGELNTPFSLHGSTIGVCYDIGYDYGLNDHFSIGLTGAVRSGIITSVEINDDGLITKNNLNEEEYLSLDRIELSIGLRYH